MGKNHEYRGERYEELESRGVSKTKHRGHKKGRSQTTNKPQRRIRGNSIGPPKNIDNQNRVITEIYGSIREGIEALSITPRTDRDGSYVRSDTPHVDYKQILKNIETLKTNKMKNEVLHAVNKRRSRRIVNPLEYDIRITNFPEVYVEVLRGGLDDYMDFEMGLGRDLRRRVNECNLTNSLRLILDLRRIDYLSSCVVIEMIDKWKYWCGHGRLDGLVIIEPMNDIFCNALYEGMDTWNDDGCIDTSWVEFNIIRYIKDLRCVLKRMSNKFGVIDHYDYKDDVQI